MGGKTSKEKVINTSDLSSLQTLQFDYSRQHPQLKQHLEGFFLNEDVDCMMLNGLSQYSFSQVRLVIETVRKPHQKYRYFFHPSRWDSTCLIKKNSRTTKTSIDWFEDFHECCDQSDEENNLLTKLFYQFFDDDTLTRFTVKNFESSKYASIDELINSFKIRYTQYDVFISSKVAKGTLLNIVVEKSSNVKTPGNKEEGY